jgi:hypothetical protein
VGTRNASSDRFEDTENWSTKPRGASGASIPGASDIAIFSFSGGTARIRSAVNVGGVFLANSFTGSLLQGTGPLTIGTSDFRVGSGTFIGHSTAINIADLFTMTGGIVRGVHGALTLSGSFSITDGSAVGTPSFTSTGTLLFDGAADQNFTKGASTTMNLWNLTLENSGGDTSDDIVSNINGGLNLSGALTVTLGNLDLTTNSVAMNVDRGITLADAAQATLTTNSNVTASGTILVNDAATLTVTAGTFTLNDDGDQTVDFDRQSLFNLTLNNTGGGANDDVIVAGGSLNASGALTVTLGNLDLSTNDQPLFVRQAVTVANAAQATLTSDANITASGSISIGASGGFDISGTATLAMNGADQEVDLNNLSVPNFTIASSSGTTLTDQLKVTGTVQVNTGSNLTLGTNTLSATGGTIINYAVIAQNTGKIVHTPERFFVANSTYAEASGFLAGNTVYFVLGDGDENTIGTSAQSMSITLTVSNGDSETVTLTETGNAAGVFRGSIASADVTGGSVTSGNSKIDATAEVTITISFTDSQDAITSTDTATIGEAVAASAASGSGDGGGGGGGGRRTAAIARGSSPSAGAPRTGYPGTPPGIPSRNVLPSPGPSVSPKLQERTCVRVSKRTKGISRLLQKINVRLFKRFGFQCSS